MQMHVHNCSVEMQAILLPRCLLPLHTAEIPVDIPYLWPYWCFPHESAHLLVVQMHPVTMIASELLFGGHHENP